MNQTPRIQIIDFLRGLSCLGVLLYHVRVELWVGWWQIRWYPQEYSSFAKAMAWLSIPTPFLGYAVLLFFLISGFCIHYPNTAGNTNPCWKTYFIRRFWRIYPAYLGALILTAGISFLCFKIWGDKTWDIERILRVASLSQNYPPGNGQFLSNPSLWTIPLELEFYILYPLAFCLFGKLRSSMLWILSLGISAISIYLSNEAHVWLSFTAFFLWPSWLLGAWISQLYRDQKLDGFKLYCQVPVIALSLSFALLSRYQNWESWSQYIAWTVFYLFFFIFCLSKADLLNRIIGRRILGWISWIGKISFSLYLIHFPLFKLFGYLHRDFWGQTCQFLGTLALFDSCNLYGVALLSMVRKSNSSMVKKENESALSSNKKFVVSHPTGNTFVRALLEELQKNQQLGKYYTTIGVGSSINPLFKALSQKRSYDIPDSKISKQWIPELVRLLSGGDQSNKRKRTDHSYLALDKKVSSKLTNQCTQVLHAYEDGAYYSFKRAKELGIQCSYELPIANWATVRRLLAEEAERYPQWEPTLESTREPEEKLFRKEEELRMAERITCPSQFVLDSIPKEIKQHTPCQISPFGSPGSHPSDGKIVTETSNSLRLLFVGSMSQRKGLADLFEAMKLLKKEPVTLSVLGQPSLPMEFYRKQFSDFQYFPPCSNQKVREIMMKHDMLVLPSVVEGRALVQQEALSCGLPIIVTRNAGGEDLVEEGLTGHLVPIRSPEKLVQCILKNIEEINSFKEKNVECVRKAEQYSWKEYASRIIESNLSTTSSILENN